MLKQKSDRQNEVGNLTRDFPAERRDTESAIRLWHQKASGYGELPPLVTFDFSRLTSDWGYRFLISGDQFVEASVFLVYGVHFARLLGLPQQPRSQIPLLPQLPARYRSLFVEGYGEVLRDLMPTCLTGTVVYQRNVELYRAAFMPIRGAYTARPLLYGSFNFRIVPQDSAAPGARIQRHGAEVTLGPNCLNLCGRAEREGR